MKRILFSIALCLIFNTSINLLAQTVHSITDSTITYSFTSETDSVLSSKVEIRRVDSIYQYEYETSYDWDEVTSSWQLARKENRIFDQEGNQLLLEWFKWNKYGDYLEPFDRIEKAYDQEGYVILDARYKWNHNAEDWKGDVKKIYERDESGNDTLMISSVWDWGIDNWRFSKKNVSRYNEDKLLTETEFYDWQWNDEVWLLYDKTRYEFIFNDKEEIETKTISSMDLTDSTWNAWRKIYYIYNEAGLVLSETTHWKYQSVWTEYTRFEFTYDGAGNTISTVIFNWDSETSDWVGFQKFNYAYAFTGSKTGEDFYKWNSEMNDWEMYSSYEWQYNETGAKTVESMSSFGLYYGQMLTEYIYDRNGQDSISIYYERHNPEDLLMLSRKSFHYHGEENVIDYTGVKELPMVDFVIFPVPVRDQLWIESEVFIKRIDVFDLKGRCVLTSGQIDNGIDLSELTGGIYMLRLVDQNGQLLGTRKVLKE